MKTLTVSGIVPRNYPGGVTMTDATSATSATPTIVFVHGAWADASGAGYAGPSGPPGWRSIPSWYLVGTEEVGAAFRSLR
jgi:hypothetical protein